MTRKPLTKSLKITKINLSKQLNDKTAGKLHLKLTGGFLYQISKGNHPQDFNHPFISSIWADTDSGPVPPGETLLATAAS